MLKAMSWSILLSLLLVTSLLAQVPTGIITGTMKDESGAVIPNATVTITDKGTAAVRTVTTNSEGLFTAPALPVGVYEIRSEVQGFRTLVRDATVEAGNTTTVDLAMQLGAAKDVVTVEAATAQVNYDSQTVQGVITRNTIQDLPLNGRSAMQLAELEPGVTVAAGSTAQFNTLFTVSILGAGNHTLFTIDGGSISDNIDTASGIPSMNFSQETVAEFQLSSVNFDLATGVTSGGAINIVTRSGSNDFHGSAYFFYRDHNIAAYPGLQRVAISPNPFFARKNPGAYLGGPIKKDKLFFFFNYEYLNQVQALPVQGNVPSLALLSGVYGSPYVGKQIMAKFDYRISEKNTLFLRYSHDGNSGFGDVFSNGDPSNWVRNTNWADQSIMGLTTIITPALVNDFRFQYMYWKNSNLQSLPSDCVFPCVGGTLPAILTVLGTNFAFGNAAIGPNVNAPQARITRRYQFTDSMSYQKGSHRIKFGVDSNRARSAGLWGFCTPYCEGVVSPEFVRSTLGAATTAALFPNLPTIIRSDADIYNLPFFSLATGIFTGVGVGSVSTPAPYDFGSNLYNNQYHAYLQDTWKIRPNLTLNYGLGWNAQTGFYNSDLHYPAILAPIIGANNLNNSTNDNLKEFAPAFGINWSPFKDNKTVLRAGGGIYWDSTPGYYKLRAPAAIGPLGDGRGTLSSAAFTNIYPGILNLSAGGVPIPVGAPIPCCNVLTTMTLGQFNTIYNQQIGAIRAALTPPPQLSGPYTVTGLDVAKQGIEIYPPGDYPLPRSYQLSGGIQRELGWNTVFAADFAYRLFENTSLGEQDLNHFNNYVNGVQTPVIPVCKASQLFVVGQQCSAGSITFWQDQGRAKYKGLLIKVQKRLSNRVQFTASYALQDEKSVTVWDNLNYFSGYGPVLARHDFNFAGIVNIPYGFQLSVNSFFLSRTPISANVSGLDLPGTSPVTSSEPIPTLPYNCLNAGCGKSDIIKAVAAFNARYAGTLDAKGAKIAPLTLPTDFQLGDPINAQNVRLTKTFNIGEKYHFLLIGEVFNVFNIANLSGYSFTINSSFGQPTLRSAQSFGSTGPRAFQFAARFSF